MRALWNVSESHFSLSELKLVVSATQSLVLQSGKAGLRIGRKKFGKGPEHLPSSQAGQMFPQDSNQETGCSTGTLCAILLGESHSLFTCKQNIFLKNQNGVYTHAPGGKEGGLELERFSELL